MPNQDVTCEECSAVFVITEDQQKYYAETGYTPPTRCPECEQKRKAAKDAERASRRPRKRYRG